MDNQPISRYENLHIVFWLIKDTCWMMELKVLGVLMILPTIGIAAFIAGRTRSENTFYLNLAICFWIIANAYWMCCEFLGVAELKNYAGFPFILGMISVVVFYRNILAFNKA